MPPVGTDELILTGGLAPKEDEDIDVARLDELIVVSCGFVARVLASEGGGRRPLERKEGQWDLSSGREEPGSRCDKIVAA